MKNKPKYRVGRTFIYGGKKCTIKGFFDEEGEIRYDCYDSEATFDIDESSITRALNKEANKLLVLKNSPIAGVTLYNKATKKFFDDAGGKFTSKKPEVWYTKKQIKDVIQYDVNPKVKKENIQIVETFYAFKPVNLK